MPRFPSTLLAAAVAAVALPCLAIPAMAQDCCTTSKTSFISTDDPAATEQSAEDLLAAYAAVKLPAFDPEKRQDQEYVQGYFAEREAAGKKRADIARTFAEKFPQHEKAPTMLLVVAQSLPYDDEAGKTAIYRQIKDNYPDSGQPYAYARGQLRKTDDLGKPFELEFQDAVTGQTLTVQEDLKGKVVVVDFWATWCGPCIAEMPTMKKLYAEYKDQGVEFIGISLDAPVAQEGRDKLLAYVKDNDIQWPQYYQGNGWQSEFSSSWGINSIPALFILDAQGKLHSTEARGKLETLIPELIAKRDAVKAETAAGEAAE